MLISTSKQFIFAANTKTASTSIEHILAPHSEIVCDDNSAVKHMSLANALKEFGPILSETEGGAEGYFKFGVIRDPIEWIGSWFRYRTSNNVSAPLDKELDFRAFWQRADWNILHPDGSGKYLQQDIFCDAGGRILADVILPYGGLSSMFAEICELMGINGDLPRKNVSQRAHSGDLIPEDLLDEMREFYAPDYALLAKAEEINAKGMEKLRDWAARGL